MVQEDVLLLLVANERVNDFRKKFRLPDDTIAAKLFCRDNLYVPREAREYWEQIINPCEHRVELFDAILQQQQRPTLPKTVLEVCLSQLVATHRGCKGIPLLRSGDTIPMLKEVIESIVGKDMEHLTNSARSPFFFTRVEIERDHCPQQSIP